MTTDVQDAVRRLRAKGREVPSSMDSGLVSYRFKPDDDCRKAADLLEAQAAALAAKDERIAELERMVSPDKACPDCMGVAQHFLDRAKAAEAERDRREDAFAAALQINARTERERDGAEAALWRVAPNTHTVSCSLNNYREPDPFEGPGETWEAGYRRLEARIAEMERTAASSPLPAPVGDVGELVGAIEEAANGLPPSHYMQKVLRPAAARLRAMDAALEPFARAADEWDRFGPQHELGRGKTVAVGDLRRARAARGGRTPEVKR